jgi:hypothetical protein
MPDLYAPLLQGIADQVKAVTVKGIPLGAHYGNHLSGGNPGQKGRQPRLKFRALHRLLQAGGDPVPPAQFLPGVQVTYPLPAQLLPQLLPVILGNKLAVGNRAHIHHQGDAVVEEQVPKLLKAVIGMADGVAKRLHIPRPPFFPLFYQKEGEKGTPVRKSPPNRRAFSFL